MTSSAHSSVDLCCLPQRQSANIGGFMCIGDTGSRAPLDEKASAVVAADVSDGMWKLLLLAKAKERS